MKTTYIIGAGANAELNLPTGYALKKKIIDYLSTSISSKQRTFSDSTITDVIQTYFRNHLTKQDQMYEAISQIVRGLPQALSIDNFIDAHRENKNIEFCSKIAIVYTILEAEKTCRINDCLESETYFASIEDTWYIPFFQLITKNCTKQEFIERIKGFDFIIFNYDRCFEYFLYNALQLYYGISEKESAEIVNNLSIIHPYGMVGPLPFMGSELSIPFGSSPSINDLVTISENISTFTKTRERFSRNNTSIGSPDLIVFLGFAYHLINLELLFPKRNLISMFTSNITCIGSTFNESDQNKELIIKELKNRVTTIKDVHLDTCTCFELLVKYSRYFEFDI